MSEKRALSLFRDISKTAGAGARVGRGVGVRTQAFKTVLKIFCKSSSEYLRILVAVLRVTVMGDLISKGLVECLINFPPDLRDGKESGGATKRVTERAMEGHFWQRGLRPRTKVILVQTFF